MGPYIMSCPEAIRDNPFFRDDEDRHIFLDIIGEASERFAIEIHAEGCCKELDA